MHRCSATSWETKLLFASSPHPPPPPSLNRRARQPSCPVLLAQWGHCGWGAAGGCAGAEMQKSSTVRTPTGPTSSCITCCKPEQPEDCSKSHSSCGNEIAESRDRRGRGGEAGKQALCYSPAQHSSALLQLEASTADLPSQHTPSLPSIPGSDAVPPLH